MIPKIIHYCWFGGNPLPMDVKKCIESWKRLCPDYEIRQWNESNFDVNSHPFMKAAYQSKAWAFVSDYARLKVVYDNGGIYLDTDVELLKNIDFLLENQCYIGIQQTKSLCTTGLGFGAEKASPVVYRMMECYDAISFSDQEKNTFACPWLNDRVIRSYGAVSNDEITYLNEVTVYPSRFFDPFSTGDTKNLLCDDTVSIHHYAATWTGNKQRWKRKIVRIMGEKNAQKLKMLRNKVFFKQEKRK
jgi:mannosyltransferase OCH1-like enzyme